MMYYSIRESFGRPSRAEPPIDPPEVRRYSRCDSCRRRGCEECDACVHRGADEVRKQEIIERTLDTRGMQRIELEAEDPEARIETAAKKIRAKREEEKHDWTAAQAEAINRGLQILAGMCDGARSVDGAGFGKMDAEFGRSLAQSGARTPKTLAIASRMIRKYRRQIPAEYAIVWGGKE